MFGEFSSYIIFEADFINKRLYFAIAVTDGSRLNWEITQSNEHVVNMSTLLQYSERTPVAKRRLANET